MYGESERSEVKERGGFKYSGVRNASDIAIPIVTIKIEMNTKSLSL